MPKGQLYINGKDAFERYGISMNQNALSTLMTPASRKEWITNEVRDKHGVDYLTGASYVPRKAKREVSITFNLVAPDITTFFSRYELFCNEVLEIGIINIWTSFQQNILYKCKYESCTQFTQFRREMAEFQLKMVENDPSDRTLPANYNEI